MVHLAQLNKPKDCEVSVTQHAKKLTQSRPKVKMSTLYKIEVRGSIPISSRKFFTKH